MSALIPIGDGDYPVLARDLHKALGVKKKYADWIRHHLDAHVYGFEFQAWKEGARVHEDSLPLKGKRRGGQNRIDHMLTVEAAKKIAMMAKTAKGNEVRDYFLECERRSQGAALIVAPQDEGDFLAKAVLIATQRLAIADGTIEIMRPAYDVSEARTQGKLSESTSSAWKASMGRRKLTKAIRNLMKAKLWNETGRGWRWRQSFIDDGWGHDHENTYGGGVKDECAWYEKGRLALPLWMAEQDRQGRTHGDVAPLPARIPDDPQGRLPEGATR